jgi:hypothetical protein
VGAGGVGGDVAEGEGQVEGERQRKSANDAKERPIRRFFVEKTM